MPPNEERAYTDIEINGECYGRALRTHVNVNKSHMPWVQIAIAVKKEDIWRNCDFLVRLEKQRYFRFRRWQALIWRTGRKRTGRSTPSAVLW